MYKALLTGTDYVLKTVYILLIAVKVVKKQVHQYNIGKALYLEDLLSHYQTSQVQSTIK